MSSATYTGFTRSEFESWLDNFASFEEVQTDASERVYAINLPDDDLELRIFSTLQGGRARSCGSDAIRCVLWHTDENAPVGGKKKTLRIETWRKNLSEKVKDLMLNWREYYNGRCPECGGVMQTREGEFGEFLGCSNYPRCQHTE